MAETGGRSQAMRQAQQERFDHWFRNRRWRVRDEVSGPRERDGLVIRYDRGEFWIDRPGIFQTPLGNRGRHGFLLRETGPDGHDLDPPVDVAFGYATLQTAISRYGAVQGLPDEPRKEPPAELQGASPSSPAPTA
jgi:hypothetical protein